LNHSSTLDKRNPTAMDRSGYILATGLGAGFMPVAPGTAGALEGVAIFLALQTVHIPPRSLFLWLVIINLILFVVGVWASNCACRVTALKDPQVVVIDEVSGQLIALIPAAFVPSISASVIIGFALFRLFDIVKPFPIRRLERLPGGFGVMADDALAGIYAAGLLWLAHIIRLI
jgi:phosphatidylglycerophosphatase A